MNNQSLGLSFNETFFYNKDSIISDDNTFSNDISSKVSDVSREFGELNREIYKTIQNSIDGPELSTNNINTNGSLGNLLDDTWTNNRDVSDSSENFHYKINEFKKKKEKTAIESNKKRRTYIKNPQKCGSQFKKLNNKKLYSDIDVAYPDCNNNQIPISKTSSEDDEQLVTDDVPNTIEEINKLYFNSAKTNNLNELNEGTNKFNHYNNFKITNFNKDYKLKRNNNDQFVNGDLTGKTTNQRFMDQYSTLTRLSTNETMDSCDSDTNKYGNCEDNYITFSSHPTRTLSNTPRIQSVGETCSQYQAQPAKFSSSNLYHNTTINNFSDNTIKSYMDCFNNNTNDPRFYRQVNMINFNSFPQIPFTYMDPQLNAKSFIEKKKFKKTKEEVDQTLYVINIENIIYGSDKRTTIMIRHIPNKYSTKSLLEEINVSFKGKFDFFYLPMDFENHCNLGYAFINFIEPLHIIYFYEVFKTRKWKKYNSHKECDLSYAKFQGKLELTSHLEKSCAMNKFGDDKKPIILPIPDPLPKIEITSKYAELFKSVNPHIVNKVLFLK